MLSRLAPSKRALAAESECRRHSRSRTILAAATMVLLVAACAGGTSTATPGIKQPTYPPSTASAASSQTTPGEGAGGAPTDASAGTSQAGQPSNPASLAVSTGKPAPPSLTFLNLPGMSLIPHFSLLPVLNGHFNALPSMLSWNTIAIPIDGNHVFLVGGCKPGDICGPIKTTEIYDANSKTFTASTTLDALDDPVENSVMTGYGMVVTFDDVMNAVLYNPSKLDTGLVGTYLPPNGTPHTTNISGAAFAPLNDGKVLMVGGWLYPGNSKTALLYDLDKETFTPTVDLANGRFLAQAVTLTNGKVLVIGGETSTNGVVSTVGTCELYSATGSSRVATGSLLTPRGSFGAIRLKDGRVLVAGGVNKNGWTTTAEIYDPATGSFTATGSLNSPRRDFAMALLNDGRVLAVGGNGTQLPATTELYNPSNGTWVVGPTLNAYPYGMTATTLGNGTVLVTSMDKTAAIYTP